MNAFQMSIQIIPGRKATRGSFASVMRAMKWLFVLSLVLSIFFIRSKNILLLDSLVQTHVNSDCVLERCSQIEQIREPDS